MSKIKKIHAREILDSLGNPTIETTVLTSDGVSIRSSIPSGTSRGSYEAVELRDNDKTRYDGLGVLQAINNVNEIIGPKLEGMDVFAQPKIDTAIIELDGTQNKGKLGANATLSVSQAVIRAGAKSSMLPTPLYIRQFVEGNLGNKIPIPMFDVIEGGSHGGSSLEFQQYLIVPASSKTFAQGLEIGAAVYRSLRTLIRNRSQSTLVADEGGFSPDLGTNQDAFTLIKEAIDSSGYSFSLDVFMGADFNANSFVDGKTYRLRDKSTPYSVDELVEFYKTLVTDYSLIYVEDPFAEADWEGWKKMYQALSSKTIIAGDNLTATNPYRLQTALDQKTIGAIAIKPAQVGTVTEAIAVAEIARYTGLKIVVSDRSGETDDPFVAEFAVGIGADYAKFGAPARERVVKYNKLLEIEYELANI